MALCEQPYSQGQLDVGSVQCLYVNNLTAWVTCWTSPVSLCEQPYSQGQLDVGLAQCLYVNNLTARVS